MKKLLIAASLVLLSACSAQQPPQLNLKPQATLSPSVLVQDKSYALTSKDLRTAQYVALVDSGHSNIEPIHSKQNLRLTLENLLADQLKSQGYTTDANSENTVEIDIQQALVNVKHSIMKNEMDGKLVVTIIAETPKGKLTKTFTGTAKRSGIMSASKDEIAKTFNDVVNMVFKEIAQDDELKNYMQERF